MTFPPGSFPVPPHQPQVVEVHVPFAPLPTYGAVGIEIKSDGHFPFLELQTPQGIQRYFFDADLAVRVGEAMIQNGRAAKAKLVIPGSTN